MSGRATKQSLRSRDQKWQLYTDTFPPTPGQKVLDVGVSSMDDLAGENYFLRRYPHPEMVVGVGVQDMTDLRRRYPAVTFAPADGRKLPFADLSFDVAHSNAVVEHVGPLEEQRRFVHELCRVAKAGFVTTPNRFFPVETHTHVPLVHWLPRPLMLRCLDRVGRLDRGFWLLSRRRFLGLFPATVETRVLRTRVFGWPLTTVVVFRQVQR